MNILNIIPISLIGTGIFLEFTSHNEKNKLKNKISNEKIYMFPLELDLIDDQNSSYGKTNQTNFIIKINKNEVNKIIKKNVIGYVGINGIVKIPKIVHMKFYDDFSNELKIEKTIKNVDVKKNFGFQILFPNINDRLILNPDLLVNNRIKILLNNKLFINSGNKKNIIEEYEEIVRKNIPNFKSDLNLNLVNCNLDHDLNSNLNYNSIELEKNILKQNSDLFLIVSNSKTNNCSKNHKKKLEINTISDSEQIIITEKYIDDISYINGLDVLSVSLIGVGFIFGFLGYGLG